MTMSAKSGAGMSSKAVETNAGSTGSDGNTPPILMHPQCVSRQSS